MDLPYEVVRRLTQFCKPMWVLLSVQLTAVDKRLGVTSDNPLLVSVRSGAKFSMPGMMDTVLNLGLNDRTVLGSAQQTQDLRFALDSYRRFISMYSKIDLGLDGEPFEVPLQEVLVRGGNRANSILILKTGLPTHQ